MTHINKNKQKRNVLISSNVKNEREFLKFKIKVRLQSFILNVLIWGSIILVNYFFLNDKEFLIYDMGILAGMLIVFISKMIEFKLRLKEY